MTENELTVMEEHVKSWLKEAETILDGDIEGYDGADGARIVEELARWFLKLAIAYRSVKA